MTTKCDAKHQVAQGKGHFRCQLQHNRDYNGSFDCERISSGSVPVRFR